MFKSCGIYVITNNINHKKYIGSSIRIEERFVDHRRELSNGRHCNEHLENEWNVYKEENFTFEILELCSKDKLLELEQIYINKFKSFIPEFGYNKATAYGENSLKPKRIAYQTFLEESLIKKLKLTAIDEKRCMNDIIEEALKDYFKKKGVE